MTDRRTGFVPPAPAPLGLGGIMATALAMYRAHAVPLIGIALISTLPVALLATGGDLAFGVAQDTTARALRGLIVAVPSLMLGQISVAATALMAMDMLNRRPVSASRALEIVGLRFWPLMAAIAVTLAWVVAGLALLIIPGIVLMTLWLFAPTVAVVEGRGVRDSMRRSVALTRPAFWWTLGSYLAIQLTVALASLLAGAVLNLPFAALDGNAGVAAEGIVTFLVSTLAQPIALLGTGLMYVERRVHAERRWPNPGTQPELHETA